MHPYKSDWIVIISWPILACFISLLLQANFFLSTLLFYGIPALYLSLRKIQFIKKYLIVSLVTLPMLLVVDFIAVKTGTWYFPFSIFQERLFGTTTFEVVFWLFIYVYFVIAFYEFFLETKCNQKLSNPKLKYVFIGFLALFLIFLITFVLTGTFIEVPYFYLVFGILFAIIPIVSVLYKFPNLFTKFAQATVYFALTGFLWELTALQLNQWQFPGSSFIGWIQISHLRFPLEELFVWIILGAAAILSWYEFFDDDTV